MMNICMSVKLPFVVGDEMIDHVNNLFVEGLIIEDIKLLYEDEFTSIKPLFVSRVQMIR